MGSLIEPVVLLAKTFFIYSAALSIPNAKDLVRISAGKLFITVQSSAKFMTVSLNTGSFSVH